MSPIDGSAAARMAAASSLAEEPGPGENAHPCEVEIQDPIADYFRGADVSPFFERRFEPAGNRGFFRFGPETICYGRCAGGPTSPAPGSAGQDRITQVQVSESGRVALPFDPAEIVDNLRMERYRNGSAQQLWRSIAHSLYYSIRPVLPVAARKHLQRFSLRDWRTITFPRWPVDTSVDTLIRRCLAIAMETAGVERVPFIWFWPEGARACATMTHDVESAAGRDLCDVVMDLDEQFGLRSSFQVVPESRYVIAESFLSRVRERGFEVNVHDLNHDGKLFADEEQFCRRARIINEYAECFGSRGFRSGAMYRNQDWFHVLRFAYDMSVPNVAHLEPQRGGCCTVMPYFVGNMLEIPLTTIQDYSLFHILGTRSIDLWKDQTDLILRYNGMMSFLTHPDYLRSKQARAMYCDLLGHLVRMCRQRHVWFALPGEINDWWRARASMQLVKHVNRSWRVEGPESHRARVAYAVRAGRYLSFVIQEGGRLLPVC